MATRAVTPMRQKHAANFDAMTPELQKVAKNFDKQAMRHAKGTVMIAYDMGAKLKDIIVKEAIYGANAVEQLAAHLGGSWSASKLYQYRDFTVAYTREQVEKLLEATMSDGGRVTVSHFLTIGKVKSAKERNKLWKKVFDEGLSSESLKADIQANHEIRNADHSQPGAGRPPSRPTSIMGGAQEMTKMCTRINKKFAIWDEAVTTEVAAKPAEEITDHLIERLTEAEQAFDAAEQNLMQYRPKLQKALDRAQKLRAKAKKDETTEKSSQTRQATGNASKKKAPAKKAAANKKAPAKKAAKVKKKAAK